MQLGFGFGLGVDGLAKRARRQAAFRRLFDDEDDLAHGTHLDPIGRSIVGGASHPR
jgi:hypothetical protein